MRKTLAVIAPVIIAAIALLAPASVFAQIVYAWTADDIATAVGTPSLSAARQTYTQQFDATDRHALFYGLDPAAALRDYSVAQRAFVTNKHASAILCVKAVTFATSCATTCANASTLTCNNSTTDGEPVMPGARVEFLVTGADCLCGFATGASTPVSATRTVRAGQ